MSDSEGLSVGGEEGRGGRKETKDICCGKTFLPASNSLALMKSWEREEREREARRKKGRERELLCCCRSHALCYLTQLRGKISAPKRYGGGHREREGVKDGRDVRSIYTASFILHLPNVTPKSNTTFF